ncbi:hypothetical protein JAO29_16940 [Edaphobacter sp. HDX4]
MNLLFYTDHMGISGFERQIRWGIEQRLEFIDFRLFWEGEINRSALTQQFGISIPQASNDLKRYEELAPGNLAYDKSQKRYFSSLAFRPQFLPPDADQYLNRLRGVADHTISQGDAWFSQMPSAESMPLPQRRVEANLLRAMLYAIRRSRSIRVLYQSMNSTRPEPLWRWISPHAFANDGLRWHVRAYCHLDRKFKDFLLPRFLEVDGDAPQEVPGDLDRPWREFFDVVLIPNPKLSLNQRNIVAQDYCMEDGRISISIRYSFLYYFQKRLRLDVARALDDPKETPVVVENREAFEVALREANK